MSAQLTFEFTQGAVVDNVVELVDRRRMPEGGGPAKLLRKLVEEGLDPAALPVAARLVTELNAMALERRGLEAVA